MSARDRVALIQAVLVEHSVIIVDGINSTRIFCRCGWRMNELGRFDAESSRALHQAEAIEEILLAAEQRNGGIVDAEVIENDE